MANSREDVNNDDAFYESDDFRNIVIAIIFWDMLGFAAFFYLEHIGIEGIFGVMAGVSAAIFHSYAYLVRYEARRRITQPKNPS